MEFLQFPPLSLTDKFRLGATIFYASKIKDWIKLENIPEADWLRKLSGDNTFNKIWLPLLRAKLGENYTQTSAAFIWATIQRMYAARNTGLKEEMIGYVTGGYETVLDTFVEKLKEVGVEIRTSAAVSKINRNGEAVDVSFQSVEQETFDEVVLTVPSTIASKMVEGLTEDEYNRLNNIQYLGVVCASLVLKKPISEYYVTNVTDNDTPFTGVIEMTAMVDKAHFGGNSLLYLPKYVKASDPFFALSDDEVKELFWSRIVGMYDHIQEDDLLSFQVARAKNVFALATLNYSQGLPPISMSVPGVHILNSAHIVNGTLNVNESIQLAEKQLPIIIEKASKRTTAKVQL